MSGRGQTGDDEETETPSQDDLQRYVMDVMDWNAYQAAAYVAVVRDGPLEPKEIVATTEIPQGRVYDVMSNLEGDYVSVQGAQPKRYQAQHPRSVLGNKQDEFNAKADAATDHLEQQYEIQRERRDPPHPAWVIPGLAGIKRQLLEGLSTAKDRVLLMDEDGVWIQDNEIRDLGRLVLADVEVEVIGQPQWMDKLKRIVEDVDCPAWSIDAVGSSFVIIDDELAIMRVGRGKTGVKIEDDGTARVLQRAFKATREDATGVSPDA